MEKKMEEPVSINGKSLVLKDIIDVARSQKHIQAEHDALLGMEKTRAVVDEIVDDPIKVVYGLNTGLGSLVRVKIKRDELTQFSRKVVLSHSCGLGTPFPTDVVRAIMLLQANAFLQGYSGVRPVITNTLISMINSGVHPIIPSQGSLGASGDLAPLAHMALVLTKDPSNKDKEDESGEAYYNGMKMSGMLAMSKAGIERVVLGPKEGLSIVNGTYVMTAIAALALYDAKILIKSADIIGAMSLEALLGLRNAYDARIHDLRPHKGQIESARNILKLTEGSNLLDSRKEMVQDSYALRCTPQVHGAFRSALQYIEDVIATELNSVTDSPLVFIDNKNGEGVVISGGNFHGETIGYATDMLGIILSGLGTLSERKSFRLTDGSLNNDLPSFLVRNPGLNTGFMIAQYTAASLASENKVLSHPSSVDSITASENQEDHVSMATFAARKSRDILNNVSKILAIELLLAAQSLNFRLKKNNEDVNLGTGTYAAWKSFRRVVPEMKEDRVIAKDINSAISFIMSGKLIDSVEEEMKYSLE